MKTQTPNFKKTSIAILSAQTLPTSGKIGVLSAEIDATSDEWKQLLPAGKFAARDGRPFDVAGGQWLMDELAFQFMTSRFTEMNQPIVVDYNHQTVNKDQTGSDAVAAGWVESAVDLKFDPEEGLFVRPHWTARAQAHIDNKEFRYLSAVFHYEVEFGRPFELRMVALTNDPGVTGMAALAALSATSPSLEIESVNKNVIALFEKLGVKVEEGKEPTDTQCTAALSAVDVALAAVPKATELETKITALSAQLQQPGAAVDLSKYVPVETYNAVLAQTATLSAENGAASVEKVIEDARAKGQVVAAEVGYLKQFGTQKGVAELSAMLEKRPAIPALVAREADDTSRKPSGTGTAELSAEDLQAIKITGITREKFLEQRKKEQEQQ